MIARDFSAVERRDLKSVMARDGARIGGSSSSSSTLCLFRWRLVPAREMRDGICLSKSYGSWLASLEVPLSMLVRRASMRLRARLGLILFKVLLSGSMLGRIVGESLLSCTLGRRLIVVDLIAGLARAGLVSHMAMHNSVKLRQMLSALRRTCRSAALAPPRMELAECRVP